MSSIRKKSPRILEGILSFVFNDIFSFFFQFLAEIPVYFAYCPYYIYVI
jgi:hypothetical protein